MIIPEEIQELRTMVRQFVDKEIIPYAGEYDRTGEIPTSTQIPWALSMH